MARMSASCPHPWELLVPAEHVDSDQLEHTGQWRQDLLSDVVGGIEAQGGVLQHLGGPADQLDEGHAGCAVHNDIGHPLTHAWLQPSVIGHHPSEAKQNKNEVTADDAVIVYITQPTCSH